LVQAIIANDSIAIAANRTVIHVLFTLNNLMVKGVKSKGDCHANWLLVDMLQQLLLPLYHRIVDR